MKANSKRSVWMRSARSSNQGPQRHRHLRLEALEERALLTTFNWHNRGATSDTPFVLPPYTDDLEPDDPDTPDNFNFLFGNQAEAARLVVDAALDAWAEVLTDFNDDSNKDNIYTLTILVDTEDPGCGASTRTPGPGDPFNGIPDEATIAIKPCLDDYGVTRWFVDPTPQEHSEYLGPILNAFAGLPQDGSPASGKPDLLSVMTHELVHALGISDDVDYRWQDKFESNDPAFKASAQADENDSPGFLYVYDTGGVEVLMTTNNKGPGGTDTGFPLHFAAAHPNHVVTIGGQTYFGSRDFNPSGFGGRFFPSALMTGLLAEVYGYTVVGPPGLPNFHAQLDNSGNLLVRGGQNAEQFYAVGVPSDDQIVIDQQNIGGVNYLVVSVTLGTPVPGTASDGVQHNSVFPFASVQNIVIQPGDGDDTITFLGSDTIPPGGVLISDATGGGDAIEMVGFDFSSDQFVLSFDAATGLDTIGVDDSASGSPVVAYSSIENVTVASQGGDDTIIVEATSGYPALILDSGDDEDDIILGQFSEQLDDILIVVPIIVIGGQDFDTLTLRDRLDPSDNDYSFLLPAAPDGSDFDRNSALAIDYSGIDRFDLFAGSGDDDVLVQGTSTGVETRINAGIGIDTIVVDSNASLPGGSVDLVQSHLTVDGGDTGSLAYKNTLILNDISDATPDTVIVTPINVSNDPSQIVTGFFHPDGGLSYEGLSDLFIQMGGGRGGRTAPAGGNTVEVHGTALFTETVINSGTGDDTITVSAPDPASPGNERHGTTDLVQSILRINGELGDDALTIDDALATDPAKATVTATSVGAASGDTLFGPSGELNYDSIAELKLFTGKAGDKIAVRATNATTITTIGAGEGDDSISVGNAAHTLDEIAGELTLQGQTQLSVGDALQVNDHGSSVGQHYVVTATGLVRPGIAAIHYAGIEDAMLHTGGFDDELLVLSTAPSTTMLLKTGGGNDSIEVGNAAGNLNDIVGQLRIDGQADFDSLTLHDQGTAAGQTYFLTPSNGFSNIQRAKAALIAYKALEGVALHAGDFDDNFHVLANLKNKLTPLALVAGAGSDKLIGSDAANVWQILGSNAGKLMNIFSFFSMENLQGGQAADIFQLASGAILSGSLSGGGGVDTLDFSAFATPIFVDLASGAATSIGNLLPGTVENVIGGQADDRLFGDGNKNRLKGNGGNDTLVGRDGNDELLGDAGRDLLFAGLGADKLFGGSADDLLIDGATAYDGNVPALNVIMSKWSQVNESYQVRIDNLRQGAFLLDAMTVTHDNDKDALFGDSDNDWLWAKLTAPAKDKHDAVPGEQID